ncbi:MAG: hypothetical protein GY910_26265 [bacterium]|nr:hypothetical protein [Deltaproteobacteria bacterium]MCP4908494.1 hypothetical protein [bacterium]
MSGEHARARRHLDALLQEALSDGISSDVIGRALLNEIIQSWLEERTWTDIADELRFIADNLDPEQDYEFMRP